MNCVDGLVMSKIVLIDTRSPLALEAPTAAGLTPNGRPRFLA